MTHTTPQALILIDVQRGMADPKTGRLSDATFTFDTQDLTGTLRPAEDVHLMSLSNLQGEYATVLSTADALGR